MYKVSFSQVIKTECYTLCSQSCGDVLLQWVHFIKLLPFRLIILPEPELVRQALQEGLLASSGDDNSVRFARAIVEDKVSLSFRCLLFNGY